MQVCYLAQPSKSMVRYAQVPLTPPPPPIPAALHDLGNNVVHGTERAVRDRTMRERECTVRGRV